jgi:hypothetical protein
MISEVKPIRDIASPSSHLLGDDFTRCAAIDTSYENIDAIHVGASAEVLWYRTPIQTPE